MITIAREVINQTECSYMVQHDTRRNIFLVVSWKNVPSGKFADTEISEKLFMCMYLVG